MADESFEHFITSRRRELELSLGDVAQQLDVSPITVSNWSNGYSRPEPAQLRGLADLLEVPVKDLSEMSGVPIWEGDEDLDAALPETEAAEREAGAIAEPATAVDEPEAARKVQLAPDDAITPLGEETAEEWLSQEVPETVEPITDDVGLPTVEAVPEVPSLETEMPSSPVSVISAEQPDDFDQFLRTSPVEKTYVEDSQLLLRYRIRWAVTAVVLLIMLLILNWAVGNAWDALRSGVESVVPG